MVDSNNISKYFNPDLGFVSRTDVIATTPGFTANIRGRFLPFKGYLRSFQPGLNTSFYNQFSTGILTERDIKVPLLFETKKGGYFGITTNFVMQNLLSEFAPLGLVIAPSSYRYKRFAMIAGSDASRKFSYQIRQDIGEYYNGKLSTTNLSVSIIPIPHISIKANVDHNNFTNVGIEGLDKAITLYTVQARLAINPRILLTGLYQQSSTNDKSYNVRFSWEYRPLSYIYMVFNSRQITSAVEETSEDQGIIKVSFLSPL